MTWSTASARYRNMPRGFRAKSELVKAYRAVFSGQSANAEQREMVLADLANHSGFYRVNHGLVPDSARAYDDGKRATFGRIFRFMRMGDREMSDLETAAMEEAQLDAAYAIDD